MKRVTTNIMSCPPGFMAGTVERDTEIDELIACIQACIEFSHSDRYEEYSSSVGNTYRDHFVDLRELLTESFSEKLYVERDDVNELLLKSSITQPFLLEGFVGSGKSTIIRQFIEDLKKKEAIYCHIDFSDDVTLSADQHNYGYSPESSEISLVDSKNYFRFCERLQIKLEDEIIHAKNIFINFSNYKILHYSKYRSLLNILKATYIDELENNKNLFEFILEDEKLRAIYTSCETNEDEWEELLYITYEFIYANIGHSVLVIDNIDRTRLPLQSKILGLLDGLSLNSNISVAPIVAIRLENFRRLRSTQASQEGALSGLYSSRVVSSAIADSRYRMVINDNKLIDEFLAKRLGFAVTAAKDVFPNEDKLKDFIKRRYGSTLNIATVNIVYSVNRFLNQSHVKRLIRNELFKWHNWSLRATAINIFNIYVMILEGFDKDFSLERVTEHLDTNKNSKSNLKISRRNIRKFHTSIYRHLILNMTEGGNPKTEIWFQDLKNQSNEGELYFLSLKILSTLYNKHAYTDDANSTHVTIGDLYNLFAVFGVPEDKVYRCLVRLNKSRAYDPNGLIFIDYPMPALEGGGILPPSVNISILPSGKYYCDILMFMTEFLFWSIMYVKKDIFDVGKISNIEDTLYNEKWKSRIVMRFFVEHILPKFEMEMNYIKTISGVDSTYLKLYRENFLMISSGRKFTTSFRKNIGVYISELKLEDDAEYRAFFDKMAKVEAIL